MARATPYLAGGRMLSWRRHGIEERALELAPPGNDVFGLIQIRERRRAAGRMTGVGGPTTNHHPAYRGDGFKVN